MELTYGFTPYLRRLGIKPRRPHSFVATNPAVIPMGTPATFDMIIGEGSDFLVDSIVLTCPPAGVGFYDAFVGMETLIAGYKCFNREGAWANSAVALGNGEFSPYVSSRSQPSPFVLPWILRSNETLRFHFVSYFAVPLAGDVQIVVNGWLLDSVGQESPFIPYVWNLSGQADLALGAVGQIDECLMSGLSDFVCTSIVAKEEWETGDDVLHNVRSENADEGGRDFMDRQTLGRGCFLRNTQGNSEPALPFGFNLLNNSVVTEINDNATVPAAIVRRPQLCLFGFFVNPAVFPNADIERGVV